MSFKRGQTGHELVTVTATWWRANARSKFRRPAPEGLTLLGQAVDGRLPVTVKSTNPGNWKYLSLFQAFTALSSFLADGYGTTARRTTDSSPRRIARPA